MKKRLRLSRGGRIDEEGMYLHSFFFLFIREETFPVAIMSQIYLRQRLEPKAHVKVCIGHRA